MKYYFLLTMASLHLGAAAQSIDLSDKKTPELKYLQMGTPGNADQSVLVNNLYMAKDGKPVVPVMGEFHFSRHDHRYWKDALLKMKASGVNIVSTYVLWIMHEEFEGRQNWTGNMNLRKFVELCDEVGLDVHLRFGPYCNAEVYRGALPEWLGSRSDLKVRSNDPLYLAYVRNWYKSVYNQIEGLLYKDGGPIMALQLENEYVAKGMVISHLMELKRIAVEEGFDVPLYTMTHWMDSEYPKGEIVPYAGYYIETPWTANGKEELPTSNFEYFTYNRISDNIGTDIIKVDGEVESLSGENNESPYFTCEIGVGTTSFYNRRAVVPEEMAGENILLRLGCGVNMMGYYMYVGGSNPVGLKRTMQSSGPRIGYDYQAPVREFGTLGTVMKETKKFNYFMNDFGDKLAPSVAYLPQSNKNRDNLQWAVRSDGNSGFLFCSNYLYKHDRKDYKGVRFDVRLNNNRIKLPQEKMTVANGTYFIWPINQNMGGVTLDYATVQPICKHVDGQNETYFFFENKGVAGELKINSKGVTSVSGSNAHVSKRKADYFVCQLAPGTDCNVSVELENGRKVKFVVLTEQESDYIWKGNIAGKDFVGITQSSLLFDNGNVTITGETPDQQVLVYQDGKFVNQSFAGSPIQAASTFTQLTPMAKAMYIAPKEGKVVKCTFDGTSLSDVERMYVRCKSESAVTCAINGKNIALKDLGLYLYSDDKSAFVNGKNTIDFNLSDPQKGVIAEVEVLLNNGTRWVWDTNNVWKSGDSKDPVVVVSGKSKPTAYAPEEYLSVYEVKLPTDLPSRGECRTYISYKGNVANAYIGSQFVNDQYFDGQDWILSVSRLQDQLATNPLTIRIDGLRPEDNNIYFEKNVSLEGCDQPVVNAVQVKPEYVYQVNFDK